MSAYQFFNLDASLRDIQGDAPMVCRLAEAFLSDVDEHIKVLMDADADIQEVAHRLRTAFGIFHAERGADLSRMIDLAAQAGMPIELQSRYALMAELVGLAEELQDFVLTQQLGVA